MEQLLWSGLVISLVVTGGTLWWMRLYRLQIRAVIEQLEFIGQHDTEQQVTTALVFKSVDQLALKINQTLREQKEKEHLHRKMQGALKEALANLSHDIRTPLTSVAGYVHLLRNGQLTAEQRGVYLKVIEDRAFSVNAMIDQLFEFTRLEAGEQYHDFHHIDLNGILREAIVLFYEDFVLRGEAVHLDVPDEVFQVHCDQEALKRIFRNLISNALTHGKGDLTLICSQRDQTYEVSFANRSDAHNPIDTNRIFDRFYTADPSRTKRTTGLGLAITKKLVEQQGGEIRANHDNGCFTIVVSLPMHYKNNL